MSTLKVDAIRHNSATSDAITTSSDGTCTARITGMTGGGGLSNRNIIINGDFKIAQHGTSSTISGYGTVDRFETTIDTGDSNLMTQTHNTLSSSDTPYSLGFRKSFKLTNHSSGQSADAADYSSLRYIVEAQDIANCGWNFTSSSSNITLSFWVKASVSQNYLLQVRSYDGTAKRISFLVNLTAGQWTKVTKTIPGDSGITVNNDNGGGLHILWLVYYGSNYVSGSTTDVWQSGTPSPVFPTTWYTTASSTFEITGVQLEVGDTATSFEFRSTSDELARCQRYYYRISADSAGQGFGMGYQMTGSAAKILINFPVTMRTKPTAVETSGTASDYSVARTSTYEVCNAVPTFANATIYAGQVNTNQVQASLNTGQSVLLRSHSADFFLGFDAELKYNS